LLLTLLLGIGSLLCSLLASGVLGIGLPEPWLLLPLPWAGLPRPRLLFAVLLLA
jgi:hypothetical protein